MKIKPNARNICNGSKLLAALDDESASLAFLDPQYRAVLDKLAFGNEGTRQIGRAKLPQMDDGGIADFVSESARALKPSGHLMLWVDKFALVSGHWRKWMMNGGTDFREVDMITWNKGRIGMGKRTRRLGEYLLVLQKTPTRSKGCWSDHGIPDVWFESADRGRHPHAKPLYLIQRLIRATTKIGDLVIDPCAGGFGVLDCCVETRRVFMGCDLMNWKGT